MHGAPFRINQTKLNLWHTNFQGALDYVNSGDASVPVWNAWYKYEILCHELSHMKLLGLKLGSSEAAFDRVRDALQPKPNFISIYPPEVWANEIATVGATIRLMRWAGFPYVKEYRRGAIDFARVGDAPPTHRSFALRMAHRKVQSYGAALGVLDWLIAEGWVLPASDTGSD